jgi:hypothetical protein
MKATIPVHDALTTLKHLTDYLKVTLALWAYDARLKPDEARDCIQCLEGAQTILHWWQGRQEEVTS